MNKKSGFGIAQLLVAMMVMSFGYLLVMPHIVKYSETNDPQKASSPVQKSYAYAKGTIVQKLSSAVRMITISNSGTMKGLCSTNACMADKFSKQLSIMKKCKGNPSGCWHSGGNDFGGIVLMSGTLISFENTNSSCSGEICSIIHYDVNGFKKPNKEGLDIFKAYITPYSVK